MLKFFPDFYIAIFFVEKISKIKFFNFRRQIFNCNFLIIKKFKLTLFLFSLKFSTKKIEKKNLTMPQKKTLKVTKRGTYFFKIRKKKVKNNFPKIDKKIVFFDKMRICNISINNTFYCKL